MCLAIKDLGEFNDRKERGGLGKRPACRKCESDKRKSDRQINRAAHTKRHREYMARLPVQERYRIGRRARLLRKYGLTAEDYDALLIKQNYGCAICGSRKGDSRYHLLHVDHDHVTGLVRGLLCFDCNRGLGCFSDSPELLKQADKYLQRGTNGPEAACGLPSEGLITESVN